MIIFGLVIAGSAAGAGGVLYWDNRNTIVAVRVLGHLWTGHLSDVIILAALLAAWFLLGLSCIHLRIRERREARAARADGRPEPRAATEPFPVAATGPRAGAGEPAHRHRHRPAHAPVRAAGR